MSEFGLNVEIADIRGMKNSVFMTMVKKKKTVH